MTDYSEAIKTATIREAANTVLNSTPLVSVIVETYNHVNYIKACLDGILMQQTDFDFEILLGEDASSDKTREICTTYAAKHPDKIRLFFHSRENNIKIGGKPTGRFNRLYNLSNTRSKYIAICEGDDYWTDPLKLQKQVDLLEKNPQASFCFSKAELLFETDMIDHSYRHMEHYPSLITLDAYLEHYYPVPHLTKMWRTDLNPDFNTPAWKTFVNQVRFFDNALHMHHLLQGPAIFLNEATGTYRVQGQSVTRKAPKDSPWHMEEIILTHRHFADSCPPEYRNRYMGIIAFHYVQLLDFYAGKKQFTGYLQSANRFISDPYSGKKWQNIKSITQNVIKHISLKLGIATRS